jgi:hypothetical protein
LQISASVICIILNDETIYLVQLNYTLMSYENVDVFLISITINYVSVKVFKT